MKSRFSLLLTALMLNSALAAQEPSKKPESGIPKVGCRRYEAGSWWIQQTDNFRVCTRNRHLDLDSLPARCEMLRLQISGVWLGADGTDNWIPRCDVIVHTSLAEYQQTLGASVGRSVGCATMKVDGGRIVSRRIDIRIDADHWELDALPHELTHVVLADRFNGRRLPPWADEGIGVLSESTRKQQIRADAFKDSVHRGCVYRPTDLLNLRRFPAAGYREAFYAQSAALVRQLVERSSHQQFIHCVQESLDDGETAALAAVYNIHSTNSLDGITKVHAVTKALSHEPVTTRQQSLIAVAAE
tara:strand:- start:95108 stop:96010 length:903 start_codon:yes stop_codon:yes gene_type:complete